MYAGGGPYKKIIWNNSRLCRLDSFFTVLKQLVNSLQFAFSLFSAPKFYFYFRPLKGEKLFNKEWLLTSQNGSLRYSPTSHFKIISVQSRYRLIIKHCMTVKLPGLLYED